MAAIHGNKVWNNAGTEHTFKSNTDAWGAYKLLCDYEAFLLREKEAGRRTRWVDAERVE